MNLGGDRQKLVSDWPLTLPTTRTVSANAKGLIPFPSLRAIPSLMNYWYKLLENCTLFEAQDSYRAATLCEKSEK
jgi:hypothetical protein